MDIQFNKNKRTLLALIISSLFTAPVYANDWVINENDMEMKSIASGSLWNSHVTLNPYATAFLTLENDVVWNGNVTLNQNTNANLMLGNDVVWNGDVIHSVATRSRIDMKVGLQGQSIWRGDVINSTEGTSYSGMDFDIQGQSAWHGNFTGSVAEDDYSDLRINLNGESSWDGNVTVHATDNGATNVTAELQGQSTWKGNVDGDMYLTIRMDQSDFQGDTNVAGFVYLAMSESRFVGDAVVRQGYEPYGNFDATVSQNSEWIGNVYLTDIRADIELSDQSSWYGDLTQVHADFALNGNAISMDNSLWQGDLRLITTEASALDTSNQSMFKIGVTNNAIWYGDAIISGDVRFSQSIGQQGEWYGNLDLSDLKVDPSNPLTKTIYMYNGAYWMGHVISDDAVTDMTLDEASRWTMTGDSKLLSLSTYNSGSSIVFASPNSISRVGQDYHTLSIGNWDVSDLSVTLRAGYYGASDYGSDKIILTNDYEDRAGAQDPIKLTVVNNGSDNTHGTETMTVVETVHGLDTFTLTNDVELGGYVYTLEQQGTNWVLVSQAKGSSWQEPLVPSAPSVPSAPPKQSSSADAIVNSAVANYLMGYAETQSLYQRMGDLRHDQADGNVWLRSYFGGLSGSDNAVLSDFTMRYHGVQLGIDNMWQQSDNQIYAGVMAGISNSNQDYDYSAQQQGDGSIKSHHVGVYAGYAMDNGFYIDSQLKYNFTKNSFNVDDSAANTVTGQDRSRSLAASIEMGKRFYLVESQSGLYLEPQVQLTVSHYGSRNIAASNGLAVNIDSYTSTQGRAGTLLGYQVNEGKMPVNFYVKGSYIKKFDGDLDYTLNNSAERLSFKDERWSQGMGVSVQANQQHNFYVDMEQSSGDQFKQHQLNAGYRYQF